MRDESQVLPNGRLLRYSYRERLVHWTASITYVYLLLTGLAFWSPWLFWIATVLGGATISRELHPWAGLIFVFATILMYRMWAVQMKAEPADKAWWQATTHYIRNEDEKVPPADRFNPGQKVLFWGFFWCGLLLLLTGLILWFPNWIPWNIHFLRLIAVIVHPAAALLTIGLFIIHVYMGAILEEGALGAIVRGYVSSGWAKEHHRIWYDQIVKGASARK